MAEKKTSSKKDYFSEEAREHYRAARKEMRKSFEALFPPEFIHHRKAARKEMLKFARDLIDHAIDRIEDNES